jgi:hypothetical protein
MEVQTWDTRFEEDATVCIGAKEVRAAASFALTDATDAGEVMRWITKRLFGRLFRVQKIMEVTLQPSSRSNHAAGETGKKKW